VKTLVKNTVACFLMLGFLISAGCASTPAYSGEERGRLISRNMSYDYQMMQDDIDHFLLLRDGAPLTYWHVQYK
jgi:hypothetical protein